MFDVQKVEDVKVETRTNINKRFAIGLNAEEVRDQQLKDLQLLHDLAFEREFSQIALSPEYAVGFALKVNGVIGIYNDIIFREFGMTPVHISEILSTVVPSLEWYFDMSIDEIFTHVINNQGGIH
ncbi:hypothetical protein CN367_11600 [Priestia megaterium]|uniref:hypothetical protein n=1 Tax=Priestia megaterium TaxID=1404 RepID=UPI000BF71793|nr:hypothetical protein [Priestia megaterium]PEZ47008.1 hypothetical protein CN367_11600 [Priestia megaterium]